RRPRKSWGWMSPRYTLLTLCGIDPECAAPLRFLAGQFAPGHLGGLVQVKRGGARQEGLGQDRGMVPTVSQARPSVSMHIQGQVFTVVLPWQQKDPLPR